MNSPTLTAAGGTQLGVILGTAAYMAPERARGGAVDERADIWAFGVVVYEMLAGDALLAGGRVVDTLSAVMRNPVDLARLPASVSLRLRELLGRCFERDPKRRQRNIGEARRTIESELTGAQDAAQAGPPLRSPSVAGGTAAPAVTRRRLGIAAYGVVARPGGVFYATEPLLGAATQPALRPRTGWLGEVQRLAGR